MASRSRPWIIVGTALCAVTCFAADLDINVRPVFEGQRLPSSQPVVQVTVSNQGRDANGQVTLTCDRTSVVYPIELPMGSRKQFLAYIPSVGMPQKITARLSTNRGSDSAVLPYESSMEKFVCAITDTPGALSELGNRSINDYGSGGVSAIYVRPSLAPERSSAYSSMAAIFISEGAERLTDVQVRALKDYTLSGGRLLFCGSPTNPVLRDPRWRDVLPCVIGNNTTVDAQGVLPKVSSGGLCTFRDSVPKPGAIVASRHRGIPVRTTLQYGLGSASFIAFDPLDEPAREWNGIGAWISAVVSTPPSKEASEYGIANGSTSNYNWSYYSPYRYSSSSYGMYGDTEPDPFTVRVPTASEVIGILVIYLIAMPVHMIVLRRFKRGELAWITAPLLSLAAAAAFFQFAGQLYKIGLTHRALTTIFADESDSQAYIRSDITLFIPAKGSYSLGVDGLENMATSADLASNFALRDGEALEPTVSGSNLSFHEFGLMRRLSDFGTVSATRQGSHAVVVNRTKYTLTNVRWNGASTASTVTLSPGASTKLAVLPSAKSLILAADVANETFAPIIGDSKQSKTTLYCGVRL